MSGSYVVQPDDLTGETVVALLQLHLDEVHRWSPADKVHALPVARLRQPAHHLYRKHGFAECAPFGDYVSDDFSLCMEKLL